MRAYAIDGFGETGSVRDLPEPEPSEGQVRVRVRAAGVNPIDAVIVAGYIKDMMEHRFPLVPGLDASGVIDAVDPGVEGWGVGDEVFGAVGKMYFGEGTFAERATMSAGTIARTPTEVDDELAAATPLAGVTALSLLDAIAPGEGETLVAVGASGGVGSFLVQLAAARGVRVIAVCSGANAELVRDLGAADVVDYTAGDVGQAVRERYPDGIDAIADMVGDRDELAPLIDQLRTNGRVASATGSADEALAERGIRTTNVNTTVTTARLDELAGLLVDGTVRRPPIETLQLDDAAEALTRVATKHVRGKLVLHVS